MRFPQEDLDKIAQYKKFYDLEKERKDRNQKIIDLMIEEIENAISIQRGGI